MTRSERSKKYYQDFSRADEMCVNCKHFHPHYVPHGHTGFFSRLDCGHCAFPRLKNRRAYDVCEFFEKTDKYVPSPEAQYREEVRIRAYRLACPHD